MADADLKELERSYEAALRDFRGAQQKLAAALAPHKPAADALERVVGCAEEYGVDPALKRVDANPDQFGVRLPAEAWRKVAPLLRAVVEANGQLDSVLAKREKQLRQADPKRLPVYQSQGRQFQVDLKKGTMTYLDAPDKPQPLELAVVHTKDQPDPGRRMPPRSRDRERGPTR